MNESNSMRAVILGYLDSWVRSNDLLMYCSCKGSYLRIKIYSKNYYNYRLVFDIEMSQPRENWWNIACYISRVTSSRFFGGPRKFEKFDGVYDRVAEQEHKLNYILKCIRFFAECHKIQYISLNDWPNDDKLKITFTKGIKTQDYTLSLVDVVDVKTACDNLLEHCTKALDLEVDITSPSREFMKLGLNSVYGLDIAKRESEAIAFTVMPRQCGKTEVTAFSNFMKEMIAGEHDGKRPIVWKRDAKDSLLSRDIREMISKYSKKENGMKVYIKEVIFNDPATIVFWSDNTKTVVKAQDEKYDPEKGLAMAVTKKFFGNEGNYYDQIKKWLPVSEEKTTKDQVVAEKKSKSQYVPMKVSEAAKALKVSESTIRRRMKNRDYLFNIVDGVAVVNIPKWELSRV